MMAQKKEAPDKKFTIAQTAQRLGCSASTVRRYLLSGQLLGLQYAKYGRIRVLESEIQRFLFSARYSEPE